MSALTYILYGRLFPTVTCLIILSHIKCFTDNMKIFFSILLSNDKSASHMISEFSKMLALFCLQTG